MLREYYVPTFVFFWNLSAMGERPVQTVSRKQDTGELEFQRYTHQYFHARKIKLFIAFALVCPESLTDFGSRDFQILIERLLFL